jgi:ribonucleotide monophosphatase NagD (HAD superfamily)
LVIGDRLDTDIEGARRLGWDSLLVLTGITGRADLGAATVTPTYVAERLGELVEHG